LVDTGKLEQLVNDYVKCWIPHRKTYTGIYENNDFGCEHLQIVKNGFNLEDFNHDELSKLACLLTRELRAQICTDHKFFWTYCAFLTNHLHGDVTIFRDYWQEAFCRLVNLVLASTRHVGPSKDAENALQYVNIHLLEIRSDKWLIAAPLTLAVLEGLLRRKNKDYVNADGSVIKQFEVRNPQGKRTKYHVGDRLNRIKDSLRCFEQLVTSSRKRDCPYLKETKTEFASLHPPTSGLDVYDLIYQWRNDLMHGNEYWSDRVPILLNVICLLVIDEVEPAFYNSQTVKLKTSIVWTRSRINEGSTRAPWELFPPDL
jgi:hypothetical protein